MGLSEGPSGRRRFARRSLYTHSALPAPPCCSRRCFFSSAIAALSPPPFFLQAKVVTPEGLSYLELRSHLLLSTVMNVNFYLLLKAEGKSVRDHPVVDQVSTPHLYPYLVNACTIA